MTTADLAFELAQAGYYVFPVKADKAPYAADGLKSASADPWAVMDDFDRHG